MIKFVSEKEILLNKELNDLDKFVINFTKLIEKHVQYVIVSGYYSLVFGRSRSTEDVDFLIPEMSFVDFSVLFNILLSKGYECANTSDVKEAFEVWHSNSIRFYETGSPIPNIEFKLIKTDLDKYSFDNKVKLLINKTDILFISPLEMQIAYKLYLSTEKADKDIEDARYIYRLFKENINKEVLLILARKLNAEKRIKELK